MIKHFFSKLKDLIRALLISRGLPWVLAGLAMLLTLPGVQTGFQMDDHFQRMVLLKAMPFPVQDISLTGMFSFLNGNPERTRALLETGGLPWWTFEELRLSFFRPLTECTHLLDYHLWPDAPVLMHVHSLIWFGVLIFVVTLLYRRIMGLVWVAGLAALLYAMDDAHGMPVAWLANRNAVIATVFGVLVLIVHDKWRQEAWKPGMIVGPLCLLLGLLSAEAAVAIGAYLLAYEIFLVHGGIRRKITGLIPYAIVGISWLILYYGSGFGTYGSGYYLDPGQETLLFLKALVERIPILLFGQWFFPGADIYGILPGDWAWVMWTVAFILLIFLTVILIPLLKKDATARFWAMGMMLALLPICATFPANRLLIFVGLGAMGLLARFFAVWFAKEAWLPKSRIWRGLALVYMVLFIIIHLIVAPLTLPENTVNIAKMAENLRENPVMRLSEKHDIDQKMLIFVNPPLAFSMLNVQALTIKLGLPVPTDAHTLTSGLPFHRISIERIDKRSLEIEPEIGYYALPLDTLFRSSTHPMTVGQQVVLKNMTAEVLSQTEDQRPLRVRFSFPLDLDDPSILLLKWDHDRFERFKMPKIGETVCLKSITFPL